MLFTIIGKHIDVSDAVKKHAEQKTSKLPKYYDSVNKVEVIVDGTRRPIMTVEIIASAEHSKVFVVSESGEDTFRCIDLAVHKLENQLRKAKGKERDNKYAD